MYLAPPAPANFQQLPADLGTFPNRNFLNRNFLTPKPQHTNIVSSGNICMLWLRPENSFRESRKGGRGKRKKRKGEKKEGREGEGERKKRGENNNKKIIFFINIHVFL